jgi:hypothetical protein
MVQSLALTLFLQLLVLKLVEVYWVAVQTASVGFTVCSLEVLKYTSTCPF